MKNKKQFTTIAINVELYDCVREFSKKFGIPISRMTERLWSTQISSSMSGSIFLQG